MTNPNQGTSEDVLRRLKEASYERIRVELKCSIELKMKDFDMNWNDLGQIDWLRLFNPGNIKEAVIQGEITLSQLNDLAHIFSCEPYIIFRPREPWVKT